MRPALAVAAGTLLLGGALLITAPATLLDARLAALSDGHLRVANAVGTIWNGSGEVVLLPSRAREALRWQIDAWPLLRSEVRGAIGTDMEGAPNGSVVYGRDHFELRALDLTLPVESILPLVTSAKIALGGALTLQLDHLAWLANTLDGQLALQWRDASVPGPQADTRIALGDLRIDLNGHGVELAGPVHNTGGDVEIIGRLTLTAAGALSLEATLRPRDADRAHADLVTATLSSFGSADGQGGYRVRWSGAWR
jgi:general secretion pathway protein N